MQRIAAAHNLTVPARRGLTRQLSSWENGASISPFYVALLAEVYDVTDPYRSATPARRGRFNADLDTDGRLTAPVVRGRFTGSFSASGF